VFISSSVFALIAYVLTLTRIWWGPREDPAALSSSQQSREPLALRATIIALVALLLIAGIWPYGVQIFSGGGP
jgi:formate hydrogenlyase subunit 3/multisubunit Na+/H+ antiporter MnhD subunit